VNHVDYSFGADVTITIFSADKYIDQTPKFDVITNNVDFKITDRKFTIDKTYNWSDFTIDGVDETTNLVGGFNIKVEKGVCGSRDNEFTITINETTLDGQTLSGTTTYNWIWAVRQNGDIIHNAPFIEGETIPFNLTNSEGSSFSGEILISGNVKELDTLIVTIQNCKIINGNNMPVRVWVEFNDYGELIDANLSGLVDGANMFINTNVGQITNEDGTI
jgi:hypothetical protein